MVRTVVSSVSSGARRSTKHEIGTLTGQRWSICTLTSEPEVSASTATSSVTV